VGALVVAGGGPAPPPRDAAPRKAYPLRDPGSPLPPTAPVRAPGSTPSARDAADILACDVEAILRARFRIAAAVPLRCDDLWLEALDLCLQRAERGSVEELTLGLSLLALLPAIILRHLPSGSLPGNLVRKRLQRFQQGEWRILVEEAWHDATLPAATATPAGDDDERPAPAVISAEERLQRQGRRAAELAAAGEYSRATATLASDDTLAPLNAATIARLHSLHPEEPGFRGQEWDAAYIARLRAILPGVPIVIDGDNVRAAIRKASVKSAGGPSGLTANHLRSAFLAEDSPLPKRLAAVFTRLVNGGGDTDTVAGLLGACRLVPLLKAGGGIRPIAIGEILRRLCGRILLQQHAAAACASLEPIQVGVGTKNGGIALFHAASTYLAANPGKVLLNIDLANAFNRMSRVAIFKRLRGNPSLRSLIPFTRLFYLREGDLVVRDGTLEPPIVKSRTGSQQGCTFGSMLWSEGWQDALEDFEDQSDFAASYVDDGTFVVDAAAAAALLQHIATVAAEHGGELNLRKCVALCSEELPDDLRALEVKCIDPRVPEAERGLVMQGVPLGHPAFVAAWLDRHLASQREILRRLVAYVPDRLAAAQMLSWCIVPRIAHILRALPPPATDAFAKAFDDACVQCFTAIAAPDYAQAGLPPAADTIMRLKLRDGGFDIGGQQRCGPAAYVAAWVTARKLIRQLAPSLQPHLPVHLHDRPAALGDPQPFDPAAVPLTPEAADPAAGIPGPIRALHDAIAQLPRDAKSALRDYAEAVDTWAAVGNGPRDPDDDRPVDPARIPLQAQLSRPSHNAFHATFVSSLASEPVILAKHRSQAGYLGMAWLQRLNHPGVHHISNEAFTTAVALHLSLPIAGFEGLTCGCGKALTGESGPLHIVSCNQFAKLPRSETFQHAFDSIIQDVCKEARIEGAKKANGQQTPCASYASVPVMDAAGNPVLDAAGVPKLKDIIPDRVVRQMLDDQMGPSGRYIVDTAIPSPEAESHRDAAAKQNLAAAGKTWARKYAIYTPVLKQNDVLLPVVCESWGGLHPGTEVRLKAWAKYLDRQAPSEDRDFESDTLNPQIMAIWRMRLSCALLLGRVGLVFSALDKLAGVPARSSSFAYRISHPLFRAREFGRLRR
jgi:hypothetical protein